MGRVFKVYLDGQFYSCKYCQTHLSLVRDVLSKSFSCRNGKAYLTENVVNVTFGELEQRNMSTGMHTVCDIYCVQCQSLVGWKYLAVADRSQEYKEGKFIFERFKVLDPNGRGYSIAQELAGLPGSDDD